MDREGIQEGEYDFPYHHLPQLAPFAQARQLFWGYEYAAYIEKILATLRTLSFGSLIDIGCGDGRLLFELRKESKARLVGTDFSEKALGFARAFSPDLSFTTELPVDQKFEAFTLIEVLEHIPPKEIETFFTAMESYLPSGSRGVITVPSVAVSVNRKHYQHFSEASLIETLTPFFTIESVQHLNQESFVVKIISRLLSNRLFILNHASMRSALYRFYVKHYLKATPGHGSRLLAIVTRR